MCPELTSPPICLQIRDHGFVRIFNSEMGGGREIITIRSDDRKHTRNTLAQAQLVAQEFIDKFCPPCEAYALCKRQATGIYSRMNPSKIFPGIMLGDDVVPYEIVDRSLA